MFQWIQFTTRIRKAERFFIAVGPRWNLNPGIYIHDQNNNGLRIRFNGYSNAITSARASCLCVCVCVSTPLLKTQTSSQPWADIQISPVHQNTTLLRTTDQESIVYPRRVQMSFLMNRRRFYDELYVLISCASCQFEIEETSSRIQ